MPRRPAGRGNYRRSPGLVLYWTDAGLVCADCTSGRRYAVSPEVVRLLDEAAAPSAGDAGTRLLFQRLAAEGLVTRSASRAWPWSAWMPEAAFFHFGTRATRFQTDIARRDRQLRAKAKRTPPPPPTKTVKGTVLPLPAAAELGELSASLRNRRTWRNFSGRSIALADLATMLQLTFGVQQWAEVKGQGQVVLKTAPSAGARHPIEAFVLAVNVEGLRAGIYHYDASRHALVAVRKGLSPRKLSALLGGQHYFAGAGAAVVMSAVFARSMWKYPSSRAYRAILIDAGHLGQTFCLLATALGLAPFCTMAFHEHQLDQALAVDGIEESAMYVVGVGSRRANAKSRPGTLALPRTS